MHCRAFHNGITSHPFLITVWAFMKEIRIVTVVAISKPHVTYINSLLLGILFPLQYFMQGNYAVRVQDTECKERYSHNP